jgi:hypothetical protein
MGVFKLKPEGLNAEDLELELIDFGLEEMGEGTGENGEEVLVLRCVLSLTLAACRKHWKKKALHR